MTEAGAGINLAAAFRSGTRNLAIGFDISPRSGSSGGCEAGDRVEQSPEHRKRALETGVGQVQGAKRGWGDCAGDAEVLVLLVPRQGRLGFVTEISVDRAVIIPKAGEFGLYCADHCGGVLI